MSENVDCQVDYDWWKDRKATALRKRKTAARVASALAQPGDAFLIVTEGLVTEPIYFDLLRRKLQLPTVQIYIQPGDASDPRHVIKTAARIAKEQVYKTKKGTLGITEPPKFDHVWAVIDTDVAVRRGFWNDVQQLAAARRVTLAHSTPCFEFWLLLHVAGYTTRADLVDGASAKSAVKAALGRDYSTDREVALAAMTDLIDAWPEAVVHAERVRQHHADAATPPPANPSTEADRLVRALDDSAAVQLRWAAAAQALGSGE